MTRIKGICIIFSDFNENSLIGRKIIKHRETFNKNTPSTSKIKLLSMYDRLFGLIRLMSCIEIF
jgi:hypothetical protein